MNGLSTDCKISSDFSFGGLNSSEIVVASLHVSSFMRLATSHKNDEYDFMMMMMNNECAILNPFLLMVPYFHQIIY